MCILSFTFPSYPLLSKRPNSYSGQRPLKVEENWSWLHYPDHKPALKFFLATCLLATYLEPGGGCQLDLNISSLK